MASSNKHHFDYSELWYGLWTMANIILVFATWVVFTCDEGTWVHPGQWGCGVSSVLVGWGFCWTQSYFCSLRRRSPMKEEQTTMKVWVSMKVKLPAEAETKFRVQSCGICWDSVQVLRPWCNVTVKKKKSHKELRSVQRQEFAGSIFGLLLHQAAHWHWTNVASLCQETLNLRGLH